jgi:hypothetical protein
MERAE